MVHSKVSTLVLVLVVLMLGAPYGSVNAMQFNAGEDVVVDCDVTLSYGAGWRVSEPDGKRLANPNNDDGNRNFDKWDMTTNKASVVADIDVQYKDLGFFVRPKAYYDYVYATDNANNNTGTNNAAAAGLVSGSDDWADDVEDAHGKDAEILDFFGYGTFDLGSRLLEARVGKQVISWGESLLISGGISSSQSHVDVAAATAVGTELKEIFLPSESAFLQVDLTDNLAFQGYYQWKWDKSKLMEGGTFFATAGVGDLLDEIDAPLLMDIPGYGVIPVLSRGQDDDASDSGQFGVGLTYVSESLNATEFGLYYINYHDKLPTLNIGATDYSLSYTEDIKLYGASFSSQIQDANVSGEISYHQDYGFQGPAGSIEGDYWQAQMSFVYLRALAPIADQFTTLGEMAYLQTNGLDDEFNAFKYVFGVSLDWYQVLQSLDMKLSMYYSDVPKGTDPSTESSTNDNLGFVEGVSSGSVGLDFTYKTVYKLGIKYENRFESDENPTIDGADRDTLALTLSYTF